MAEEKAGIGQNTSLAAERRMQIFEAAARVFARRGFHNATVQEIATEAGLGKGTIYEYVKSKNDLLFMGIEEAHRRLFEQVDELIARDIPPVEKLRAAVGLQLELIDHYYEAMRAVMPVIEGFDFVNHDRAERLKTEYIKKFTPIYEQGLDAGVFRKIDPFVAMETISYNCVNWAKSDAIRERFSSSHEFAEFLLGLFFEGILEK
jgi:TetR/AcrR family fatty acid metabolism transcriptional regulator